MKGNNPLKEDPKLVELLQQLDGISTHRQFRRWKKSFLCIFETYLENAGCAKVRQSYRKLSQILSRHVELVKQMHAHIQMGNFSKEGCTVRARQTLANFLDQMIRVKQVLIDLLPTTAKMEKEIGYTKFHLAAVLIDNGFIAYDRLSLCDDIHFHFKKWCLQDVASKLFLLELDHYHRQLDIFCDILADLGLKEALETCLEFLHLDDEETIAWNGDGDGASVLSASVFEDDSLFSDDEDASEEEDVEPCPDLSDITFDDEATYNLPLWKVNEFYVDNAEMAESFRKDLKRQQCQTFNDNIRANSAKPPLMPRRSRDDVVMPEVAPAATTAAASKSSPTMPRRRRSNEGQSEMQVVEPEEQKPTKQQQQQREGNKDASMSSYVTTTTTTTATTTKKKTRVLSKSQACAPTDKKTTKLTINNTSHGGSKRNHENKKQQPPEKAAPANIRPSLATASSTIPHNFSTTFFPIPKRGSARTMGTEDATDSSSNTSFGNDESDNSDSDSDRDEDNHSIGSNSNDSNGDNGKTAIKTTNMTEGRKRSSNKPAYERSGSFYNFGNYYHGNPSDWKWDTGSNHSKK